MHVVLAVHVLIIGLLQLRFWWLGGHRRIKHAHGFSRALRPGVVALFIPRRWLAEDEFRLLHKHILSQLRALLIVQPGVTHIYQIASGGVRYGGRATGERGQQRFSQVSGLVLRFLEHQKSLLKTFGGAHLRDGLRYSLLMRGARRSLSLVVVDECPSSQQVSAEYAHIRLAGWEANTTLGMLKASTTTGRRAAVLGRMRSAPALPRRRLPLTSRWSGRVWREVALCSATSGPSWADKVMAAIRRDRCLHAGRALHLHRMQRLFFHCLA